jgi:phage I-like protein
LGKQRSAALTHVSADGAEWIHDVVRERAAQAVICLDAFHVVAWATAALDAVRRGAWNQLRSLGDSSAARELKGTRWALLKNPPDLTGAQRTTIAIIATVNKPLYRAYLLKEQLREVFAVKGDTRKATAGRLAVLGAPIPAARVCQARQDDHPTPTADSQHARARTEQRPQRGHQHSPTTAHPPRLRIPQRRSPHRHR